MSIAVLIPRSVKCFKEQLNLGKFQIDNDLAFLQPVNIEESYSFSLFRH